MSEKLRKEMDEEIPFTKKIFASAVVATIVGGAAVALTKNKRKSVVASLAALALSFIIQWQCEIILLLTGEADYYLFTNFAWKKK